MKRLRSFHRLLGSFFAPLILFFAVSGLWQIFGLPGEPLRRLSTLHTLHQHKDGSGLANPAFAALVVLMALAWIATTLAGLTLAFRDPAHRRQALLGIAVGVALPTLAILLGRLS
jgi:hypothetical protein